MTFEELQKANDVIKSTDIKGKEYAEVNQRIKAFRMLFPDGRICTRIISNEDGVCVFMASIHDENGNILGTGHAYEKEGSNFINQTSYIENCETSAVGRALAMCGIGIDVSIASKEEVENAKLNQNQPKKAENKPSKATEQPKAKNDALPKDEAVEEADMKARVLKFVNDHGIDAQALAKSYKVEKLTDMKKNQLEHYINYVKKNGGEI